MREKDMTAALGKLKDQLADRYGENSVMWAKDVPTRPPVPSGSLALDYAVGIGGLPPDRIIEVAGSQGAGKTTLGLLAMSQFLDKYPDRAALILDTEHKLTMDWVERLLGSERMDRVILAWPDHVEQATDIFVDMVSGGNICFCLFDSIGGAPAKAVTQKSAEIGHMAGNAGPISRFSRLAAVYCQKYECLLFGVNQIRMDMEGFHRHMTPGGEAWKHHCVLRLLLRRSTRDVVTEKINGEDVQIGFKVTARVVKNQLAPENRVASYWLYNVETEKFGFGIDTLEEIVRLSTMTKVIEQAGAYYRHSALPDNGSVQGRDKLIAAIRSDPSLKATITSEVMAVLADDKSLLAEVAPMSEPVELG